MPDRNSMLKLEKELSSGQGYMQTVLLGERLASFATEFSAYPERRRLFPDLEYFLKTPPPFSVCIIFGLRRTGKSVMMGQALNALSADELSRTAYIKAEECDTAFTLRKTLHTLQKSGVQNVFIDEATLIEGLSTSAATLADVFRPLGMKIVMAGTDSLLFSFMGEHELYDRAYTIPTTNILFTEHAAITGRNDIINFIDQGGIFTSRLERDKPHLSPQDDSFASYAHAEKYSNTAIAFNIQHSLELDISRNRFGILSELYNKGHLTNVISRIVNDINNTFTMNILNKNFSNIQSFLMAKGVQSRRDIAGDVKDVLNDIFNDYPVKQNFMDEFAILDDLTKRFKYNFNEDHLEQIIEYLKSMNVLRHYKLFSYSGKRNSEREVPFISQPGLRFRQSEFFVEQVLGHPKLKELRLSATEMVSVKSAMLNVIRGKILEEIVLFEANEGVPPNHEIFQYRDNRLNREFDMVIRNTEENLSTLYEIKLSPSCIDNQAKHLRNEEMLSTFSHYFGDIAERSVLYRGEDHTAEDGVKWINVENFLKEMAEEFPEARRDAEQEIGRLSP